jgi:hypothetical protein
MSRKVLSVISEVSHQIPQRGNNRQEVFFSDDDRGVYLSILTELSECYGFELTGCSQAD